MLPASNKTFCPILERMLNNSQKDNEKADRATVIFHGLFSGLGILENALILWVVGFRVRRTVVAVWVLNLALSDFLATLTLPLFTYYLDSSHNWKLGQPLCTAQSTLFYLNMFVSAFLLAVISLDRCLLVVRPLWSKCHRSVAAAWKICGLGWLWAALNALPYFLFRSITTKSDGHMLCYHNFALYSSPNTLQRDCQVRQEATALSKFLLAFLIPLGVIAGSYICLTWRLRARQKQTGCYRISSGTMYCSPIHSGTGPLTPRFTKMMVAVVMVFTLCWSPYQAFCLLELASQYWPSIGKMVEVGLPIATSFSFLNPVLNPFLYAFSCPHFCVRIRESLGALMEGLLEESEDAVCSPVQNSTTSPSPQSTTMLMVNVEENRNSSR